MSYADFLDCLRTDEVVSKTAKDVTNAPGAFPVWPVSTVQTAVVLSGLRIARWLAIIMLLALAQHLPDVISALVEAAKKGDTAAAKLILERTIPALRPEELPVSLDGLSGSRAQMVSAVIDAITSGKLDTARGGRLIVALAPEALEERIEKWERIVQEVNHE